MTRHVLHVQTKRQLQIVARELGVRPDWHEPDEQQVTAVVKGESFDNAGFWGSYQDIRRDITHGPAEEMFVQLRQNGETVAEINLATLFAIATQGEDK